MSGRYFKSQEFTAAQLRAFTTLADAIQVSLEAGQRVPCQERPTLFDAPPGSKGREEVSVFDCDERERQRLCRGCPALRACLVYASSGVEIGGFVAGGRQQRGTPTTSDTVVREAG